jgi:hypothetical protein
MIRENALYTARDFAFNLRDYTRLLTIIASNLKPLQPEGITPD